MSDPIVAGAVVKAAKSKKLRRYGFGCLIAAVVFSLIPLLLGIGLIGGIVMVLGGDDEAEGLASDEPTALLPGIGGPVDYDPNGSTFVDRGGSANAWGGHSNGRIPSGELCTISWARGKQARCDAVAALERLNAAYSAAFGTNIAITDGYRTYDEQVSLKASWCGRGKCNMAATPGTSNHGWALAFDLGGGINVYGTAPYAWMKTHGHEFGYYHPTWAEPGHPDYAKPEPWHWQYVAAGDPSS